MANILIIDSDGVGLSFAWRCAQAGHTVKWYLAIKPNISKHIGDGFKGVEKVENWVSWVKWADLIFPTSNDLFMERMDFFRGKGAKIFGPTTVSANLEIKRAEGMKLLQKVGIEIAPFQTFKNMEEAKKHVEKTGERFVFKTMGDNEDKALTYCSKSAADLIGWIERMIEQKKEPKGEIMLQTFIDGIEIGVSRWMGSKGFVGPYNESFEHKKLMSSNYGCNTGEVGTIAAFVKESKLGEETLSKLEEEFVKIGHTGDMALGFMVDEKGKPYPTEFTNRPGWPIFNMMLASISGDPVQWMIDAHEGKDTTSFKTDIGCCLVMTHGDFPYGNMDIKEVSDVPIFGITKGNKKHLSPQSIKIDVLPDMDGDKIVRRPMWNTCGDYVMAVNGFGSTVRQAADRAYKTTKQMCMSNMQIRDDIGELLEEQLPKLHSYGYAKAFEYGEKS